jgi:hypothetical protein
MEDRGEKSNKRDNQKNGPEIYDTAPDGGKNALKDASSCPEAPESRQEGLNLDCAVFLYYEIIRLLEPEERLIFFKITNLLRHIIIFQEFL